MRLMVRANAAATAANILAQEQLFRWGFVADLIPLLCNMILAVIFYNLFKLVNRSLAALTVLFATMGTAIQASVLRWTPKTGQAGSLTQTQPNDPHVKETSLA